MYCPLVSLVIPVCNTDKYLETCLESVINQTYNNIEIIVIDDGSTDSSATICDAYRDKDSRIQVIHQPNQGIGASRNHGLDCVHGDYMLFVDSDDYIEMNLVEKAVSRLQKEKYDVIFFGHDEITNHGVRKAVMNFDASFNIQTIQEYILIDRITNFLWNKMYRSELWKNIRFPIGLQYEDLFIHPSLFLGVRTFSILSDALYHYNRLNDSSITGKKNEFSSWGRYNKFLAYKEHERVSKLFSYKEGEEWAVSRCIHEGIKSLYIDYHSVRCLSKQEKQEVLSYLKTHKSNRISLKYKILQFMSKYFLTGLKMYSHIRYFQVKVKNG